MLESKEMERILRQRYGLETELIHLLQWQERQEARLPELKAQQREAKIALVSYENAGLSGILDKLSGKREQRLEELAAAERRASQALAAHLREKEELELQIIGTNKSLDWLRGLEQTHQDSMTPALQALKARLEATAWTGRLLPLLEENHSALLEARNWARGGNLEFGKNSEAELGKCLAEADALAKQCADAMEHIAASGILLEIPPYFANPEGYICNATRYNRMDRINRAIDSIDEARSQAQSLLNSLQREEI